PEPGSNSPRKFVAHFESDEIDLISIRSGHKTFAFILTRCSVFKDQTSFCCHRCVSAATFIIYHIAQLFVKLFLISSKILSNYQVSRKPSLNGAKYNLTHKQ
ncbi:hypothetical protein, partial [Paenibacillus rhizosphaerae]|uniref:hypothetical protein n=1 Tax=Paenibacillus rhizosphaerae TaxID=297318 RepID=UPI00195B7321